MGTTEMALREAVLATIRMLGIDALKRTSLFASSQRVEKLKKAA